MKKKIFQQFFVILLLTSFIFAFFPVVQAVGWISISYPSGGTFYDGDTLPISWSSQEAGTVVTIELYYSGNYYELITSSTANDGSYTWTIPSGLTSAYGYQIKITSISDPNLFSYSNYFSINERYITITVPSLATQWYHQGSYYISWNSFAVGSYVNIELYSDGQKISIIDSYAYNNGNYYWTVPSSITAGSSYRVKITSISYTNEYAYSSYFSIVARTITLTKPQDEEIWYKGETNQITWTSQNAGNYVSLFYEVNSQLYTITSSIYNSGSYSWTIPTSVTLSSSYRIYIRSIEESSINDYSNFFTIDERFITPTAPHQATVWYTEETYNITWDSKNAGNHVFIQLINNRYATQTISSNTTNDGRYSWKIPRDILSENIHQNTYVIKISSIAFPNVVGTTTFFTIQSRTINIYSPSGGETWYHEETHMLTWESQNTGTLVTLELFDNGKYHSTIATDVDNTGYYSWKIPTDLPKSLLYSIKITSQDYENIYAHSSGFFSVDRPLFSQWISIILIFIALAISTPILYFTIQFIKKHDLLQKLIKKQKQQSIQEKTKNEISLLQPTTEEYENIWEKR